MLTQRLSPALAALTIFWIVYGITAAFALYQAMQDVNRELFVILAGTGAVLVVATFALVWRDRAAPGPTERKRG